MDTSVPRFCSQGDGFPTSVSRVATPIIVLILVFLAGCSDEPTVGSAILTTTATSTATSAGTSTVTSAVPASGSADEADGQIVAEQDAPEPTVAPEAGDRPLLKTAERPDWLGTRVLPTVPDGRVVTPQSTPDELRDRRFATIDVLDAPVDEGFVSSIGSIPAEVLARSTWVEGCPVESEDLSYLTMSFWGFDGRAHTGEMIVNRSVAEDIVTVFGAIFDNRFPIEQMTVVNRDELDAEPTGDGNNTTAFVCRPVTGGSSFSQHAFGLAIDINPFHNPYIRGDLVLPELAVSYLDRAQRRAGMVTADGPVPKAFADIGWSWGGDWQSLKDYQHFSANNR